MNLINSPSQPPSSSMQHAASRHRDNLDDYRRDFLRTRVGQAQADRLAIAQLVESPAKESGADE
jgi:hypothetical protein